MKVVAWIAPGTWDAVVTAAQNRPKDDQITLVAVADTQQDMPSGIFSGLMGRGHAPGHQYYDKLSEDAAQDLLEQAKRALGRECDTHLLVGRTERVITEACDDADLLLLARDGDRSRLGPHSIGRHTRFVIDHAPCTVAVLWPGQTPSLDSIPDELPPEEDPANLPHEREARDS
ncbi:universal stress protein [Actinomycetaceae bacterium L2_0104]